MWPSFSLGTAGVGVISVGEGTPDPVADFFFGLVAFAGFCCPSAVSAVDLASAFLARVFFRFSTAPCISPRAHRTVEKLALK